MTTPPDHVRAAYDRYIATVSPDSMAISWELSMWLWGLLHERQPRRLADLGSGWSSALFRFYSQDHPGSSALSVDNDPVWAACTRGFLTSCGLPPAVHIWGTDSLLPCDLVLHDLGNIPTRVATAQAAMALVVPGGALILDDMHFNEMAPLKDWPGYTPLPATLDHFGRFAGMIEVPA